MIGRRLISAGHLALVAFIVVVPATAVPQSNSDLVNRISRVERAINDLQRHLFSGDGNARPSITSTPVQGSSLSSGVDEEETTGMAARTEIRLQQLEAQMRNLTGKVENVDFELEQLTSRIDSLVSDLDERFGAFEARLLGPVTATSNNAEGPSDPAGGATGASERHGQEPGAKRGVLGYLNQSDIRGMKADKRAMPQEKGKSAEPKSGQINAASGPILPDGNSTVRYQHAFGYLMRHEYKLAERALREFTKVHADDPLAGNAMYWLGETYYVREQFAEAAVTFAEGYEKYPSSPKTADNLLKLGFSLVRLQRVDDACIALAQLRDEFPNASVTIKRRATDEGNRIGCKG